MAVTLHEFVHGEIGCPVKTSSHNFRQKLICRYVLSRIVKVVFHRNCVSLTSPPSHTKQENVKHENDCTILFVLLHQQCRWKTSSWRPDYPWGSLWGKLDILGTFIWHILQPWSTLSPTKTTLSRQQFPEVLSLWLDFCATCQLWALGSRENSLGPFRWPFKHHLFTWKLIRNLRADAFDQAAPFVTAPFRLCRFGTVRLLCPVEVLRERSREMASGWRGTIYGTIGKNIWHEKAPLTKLHETCLT